VHDAVTPHLKGGERVKGRTQSVLEDPECASRDSSGGWRSFWDAPKGGERVEERTQSVLAEIILEDGARSGLSCDSSCELSPRSFREGNRGQLRGSSLHTGGGKDGLCATTKCAHCTITSLGHGSIEANERSSGVADREEEDGV